MWNSMFTVICGNVVAYNNQLYIIDQRSCMYVLQLINCLFVICMQFPEYMSIIKYAINN